MIKITLSGPKVPQLNSLYITEAAKTLGNTEACWQLTCAEPRSKSILGITPSNICQTAWPYIYYAWPVELQRNHEDLTWFYRNSGSLPLAQQTSNKVSPNKSCVGWWRFSYGQHPSRKPQLTTDRSEWAFLYLILINNITIYWSLHLVKHLTTTWYTYKTDLTI